MAREEHVRASAPGSQTERLAMTETWPWFAVAGLGALHGLNPGMGWLFAVALGLNRQRRSVVYVSLLPIAAGHAISIVAVAGLLAATDYLVTPRLAGIGTGLLLIGWALYHWAFGHRHRVRFGLQVGLFGLAAWSFLMATAHGAGLMLWPALHPPLWVAIDHHHGRRWVLGDGPDRCRPAQCGDAGDNRRCRRPYLRVVRSRRATERLGQRRFGLDAGPCSNRHGAARRLWNVTDGRKPRARELLRVSPVA